MNSSNSTQPIGPDICAYQRSVWSETDIYVDEHFIFICIAGSILASLGLVLNICNAMVLVQPSMRSVYGTLLLTLAIMDICIFIEFILIFSVESYAGYYQNVTLWNLWLFYLKPLFLFARVVQMSQSCVMIWATLERCLAITASSFWKRHCTQRGVFLLVFITLLVAFATRLCTYFELYIGECPENTGLARSFVWQNPWIFNRMYRIAYGLIFGHFILIVVPFLVLVGLNIRIVFSVQTALRKQTTIRKMLEIVSARTLQKQEARKSSTKSIIIISVSYLLCYSLQFILAILEIVDDEFLAEHPDFYSFSRDTINMLTVLNSALRPIIYYVANPKYRSTCRRLVTLSVCRQRGAVGIETECTYTEEQKQNGIHENGDTSRCQNVALLSPTPVKLMEWNSFTHLLSNNYISDDCDESLVVISFQFAMQSDRVTAV